MIKKPKKYSVFSLVRNALSYHENWQPAWRNPEIKKIMMLLSSVVVVMD